MLQWNGAMLCLVAMDWAVIAAMPLLCSPPMGLPTMVSKRFQWIPGRWRVTGEPADSGAFKIPTLRNIGFTAPYMHDGRFEDLNAVVSHYASGGEGHAHQDAALAPFTLNEQEHSDLLAFLFSLNDTAFVNDARWQP